MNKPLNFNFTKDIIWYDGLLLSLGITAKDKAVLQVWCDENHKENFSLYAYIYINKKELESFINAEKSYFDVIENSKKIILFKYGFNKKQKAYAYDFEKYDSKNFLLNYGPEKSLDLSEYLKEIRTQLDIQGIKL